MAGLYFIGAPSQQQTALRNRSGVAHRFPEPEFFHDYWPELRNITCAQCQNHVSIAGFGNHRLCGFRKRNCIVCTGLACLLDLAQKSLSGDTLDGWLAGRVNIEDKQGVCI